MFMKKLFINILILLIGCFLFWGCGPSTTTKPTKKPFRTEQVSSPDIMWILRRENNIDANFIMPDLFYTIVDEEWFKQEIMPGFQNFLSKNGINSYSELRNDCDDFARAFSFYVRVKFRTMGYMKSTPAVGDFYYSDFDTGHAINVGVFFDKSGNKVVRFIEPQFPPRFVNVDDEVKKFYVKHLGM
jgi:hypothetical protein